MVWSPIYLQKKIKTNTSSITKHLAILNGDIFSWVGLSLLKSSMTPQLLEYYWIQVGSPIQIVPSNFIDLSVERPQKKNNKKSVPCANPSWLMVNEPFWARGSILRQNNVLNGRYTSNIITKSHIKCHTLCKIEDPGTFLASMFLAYFPNHFQMQVNIPYTEWYGVIPSPTPKLIL